MRFFLGIGLGVLVLTVAGCGRRETPAEAGRRTQTLLISNGAEPADLDPQVIWGLPDDTIVQTLFEGLTTIDETTTKPVPAAASGWEVSKDGLVATFHLRPDGRWSDGNPVTAEDFVYSYRRILSPNFAAVYAYMLWPLKNAQAYNQGKIADFSQVGVKALDRLTLQLTLETPLPYLPALVAHESWFAVPRAAIEKFGRFDQKGTHWTRPGNLVGNGPFILKVWVPNSRIVVEKNPNFRDAANVRLNRIEFFPIEDRNAEEAAFRSGLVQVTYGLPPSKIPVYRRSHPDEFRIDSELGNFFLFVNVHRPPLDNPKVRRALSMAIDRDAISRDILFGAISPAHSFTPPDCAGYTPQAKVPDDFEQARRLLAEAGYPGGRGLPKMEVESYSQETALRSLEAIQARWARDLGVHITIRPMEFKTALQDQQSHNFMMAYSGWIADYADPSTFLDLLLTGNANNSAGWSNPEYDSLVRTADTTLDQARRYALYQKAEAILLEQAPVIPLLIDQEPHLVQPWIRGYKLTKLGHVRFQNVWLEPPLRR